MLRCADVKRRSGVLWKTCRIILQRNKLIVERRRGPCEIPLIASSRVAYISRFWKKVVCVQAAGKSHFFKIPRSLALTWVLAMRAETLFNPNLSMENFDCLSVVGRGIFGTVRLARHRGTGEIVAIKSVHKSMLIESDRVNTILSERSILHRISHPFITELKFAFQSIAKFYLGMEFVPGGDLLGLLTRGTRISLADAKLYIAEVGLALTHLHQQGIVYRDLKPENILIGADGHLKLGDFGFAKEIHDDSTCTFCGTIDFMPPEIVQSRPHSYAVDSWALGVLAYELIFGTSPFYDENREKMFARIVNVRPDFPRDADGRTIDFLQKLLIKDPSHRFSFAQLQGHSFFEGISMADVLAKRIQPAFVPQLRGTDSTEFFEEQFTREPALDSLGSIGDCEEVFEGFDFCKP
jgi:serine/threonine protein kinase